MSVYKRLSYLIFLNGVLLSPCFAQTTVIGRLCDGGFGLKSYEEGKSNLPLKDDKGNIVKKDEEKKCVISDAFEPEYTFDSKRFIKRIREEYNAAKKAVEKAQKATRPGFLDTILQMAGDTNNDQNTLMSVEPNRITFLADLALTVYHKEETAKNKNNVSEEYNSKLEKDKGELEDIIFGLDFIKTEEDRLKNKLGSDSFKEFEEKYSTTHIDGIEDGESPDLKMSEKGGKSKEKTTLKGLKGKFSKESSQKSNISVINTMEKFLPEFIKNFNSFFTHEKLSKDSKIGDYMSALGAKKVELKNKKRILERKTQAFSDPYLKDFAVKLVKIPQKEAEGFEPVDVFYRNIKSYEKGFKVVKVLSKAKYNKETDGKNTDDSYYQNKQFSGVMLFKDGGETGEDEIIFIFSGSNSAKDWERNLDLFKKVGAAQNGLGLGLNIHQGIFSVLDESITENGTKFFNWVKDYKIKHKESGKRKLKITTTGHSLGGALALLQAIYLKQKFIDRGVFDEVANVSLNVTQFAAPPILSKKSAEKVEHMLGKNNVISVWAVGDPVRNLSVLHKDDKTFKQSAVSKVIDFSHVGQSIPLFDTEQLLSAIDKLKPFKKHGSDWYANLVHQNEGRWKEHSIKTMKEYKARITSTQEGNIEVLSAALNDLIDFWDGESLTTQVPFEPKKLNNLLSKDSIKTSDLTLTLPNFSEIEKHYAQKGKNVKVTLTNKGKKDAGIGKTLNYTHDIGGEEFDFSVTTSTSCQPKNFLKKVDTDALKAKEKDELTCGCCL
ncbi:MAG TPA: hypothetical protein VI959_00945, partial [Alphaproteobacteria bacterium]|nr:hypothetical protein [Alphaproteobacteria bacterium]